MKIKIQDKYIKLIREDSDPKYRNSGWGSDESRLLYHLKKKLIELGFDVIKKRMCKDGHLVDDHKQYIRTRDFKNGFCIYDLKYQIRNSAKEFNESGEVELYLLSFGNFKFPQKLIGKEF